MTQEYVGVKCITAWPQDRPSKENPELLEKGYAVKYPDGYISWSPKGEFEKHYFPLGNVALPTIDNTQAFDALPMMQSLTHSDRANDSSAILSFLIAWGIAGFNVESNI